MDYSPYPNKLTMLLDIMDNLPRLHLSSNHFKFLLWLLKQVGVQQVPSYDAFRKVQQDLTKICGSEPIECTSSMGNHFYVNDPREAIKRQFANPQVAPHINFYPEETDGPISEVWQADRWKEFDASDLTLMYSKNGKQFYVNEVAMLHDSRLVIPLLWVKRHGVLHADCNIVDVTASISANEFDCNYFEIVESFPDKKLPWQDLTSIPVMPNPKRELVGKDEDLYVVMIPVWSDDVSGNKSKQYNKHINLYMENSNLPAQLLQQEYFVNFLSTSPHATSPEQLAEIRKIVNDTQTNPIRCFNADTKRKCGVILRIPSLPADNPQQSEEASHIGTGNKLCRRCHVGGSHKEKESDTGYHALYYTGVLRSAAETKEVLKKQLKAAMTGVASRVEEIQTQTGTKDTVTEHWIAILLKRARETLSDNPRKKSDELVTELTEWLDGQPGEKMNPLLDISGLDPTQDTPVEILHTILLGIVKYVWFMFHSKLSEEQQRLFTTRLQSTDTDGLSVPPIRAAYMMQYRNALIGKHFKTLMQTMVFHVHDLVTPSEFEVIKAVGELRAIIWVPEIRNMDQYLVTIHNSTEIFECFNAVFRMCSILSNHQAPSRDIARKFASMDRLKHILSEGYWLYNGEWMEASLRVRQILKTDVMIQRHLGWVPPCNINYDTNASSVYNSAVQSNVWVNNKAVIAKSGDSCEFTIGRLREILSPDIAIDGDPDFILTIERFILGVERHPDFDMPVLSCPQEGTCDRFLVVEPQDVLFCISVQHDCRLAGCKPSGSRVVRQEWKDTSRRVAVISHEDDDNYIVNTHALHNAILLQDLLPRSLTSPTPLHQDRQKFHFDLAKDYRLTQEKKRKVTAEKRKQKKREEFKCRPVILMDRERESVVAMFQPQT
ncbi:hypothetical protein K435DRAFT_823079 [Dendrothele bispora CBS 962.96]|uniref:Uncharacterized protein n=1 Tax=Dendrothele bispora (strain CBS 962.96) TaxID=1314807 RepID=A0A4V4HCF1_DENBC|nr:hypothetical protein K435DRAFT_823079 [Dendrothele bispora CBS 962.96]